MAPEPKTSSSEPNELTAAAAQPVRTRRRPRFWVLLGAAVIVALTLVTGIVIAVNVFTAKNELEAAVPLVSKLESAISRGDDAQAATLASEFQRRTGAAATAVGTPFYSIGEVIPGVGANLTAIKTASQAADDLAINAVVPASMVSIHAFKASGGAIDLDALAEATPIVHTAAEAVDRASGRMDAISTGSLLPQVASAVDKFDGQLQSIKTFTDGLDSSIDLLPAVLGADAPRTYLLVFQNNAELRALGGNPAALLEVTVDKGKFTVVKQSDSDDFNRLANIPISSDVEAVYGPVIGEIIQNSTMVPDFPTVGGYAQRFWADRYGTKVDGVLSFDPVAMAGLLKATGPLTIDTGDTLTTDNATELLLSTVYDRYRDPADQDAFFAKVASAMFQTVISGKGSSFALMEQFSESIADNRLLLWSADSSEEAAIANVGAAGTLPTDNTAATTVGAWINDFTFAKMGYYLDAKIAVQPSCGDKPYSITESLTNTAPAGVGVLPPYVTGPIYLDGVIHTDVVFTGPVGSSLGAVSVGGATVVPAGSGMIDGRPVVRVSVTVPPGSTTTIGATFAPVSGASANVLVRSTPMVRDAAITVTPCS